MMHMMRHKQTFLLMLLALWAVKLSAFTFPASSKFSRQASLLPSSWSLTAVKGDPVRAATGIRPSLHPLTINAISTVLQQRTKKNSNLRVDDAGVAGLDVALAAGKIVADALQKRQEQSKQDDMILTPEEAQTVAGRVVGVTMRLPQLEQLLYEKCKATPWIAKYGEWFTFGVLQNEEDDESKNDAVDAQIKMDPLFAMNRAECLLAIFLDTVEKPELKAKGAKVPDGSKIDFLDADRREVLLVSTE